MIGLYMLTMKSLCGIVIGLLLQLIQLESVHSGIDCECTTEDCIRDELITCVAESICYAQLEPDEGVVVRGCIDTSTPLLCENRPPNIAISSWPILYCCQTSLCNFGVTPTMPQHVKDLHTQHGLPLHDPVADDDDISRSNTRGGLGAILDGSNVIDDGVPEQGPREPPELLDKQGSINKYNLQYPQPNSNVHYVSKRPHTINPLYIGVPVAGACVLLALVIFAIYIIKRQNQFNEELRYENSIKAAQTQPVLLTVPLKTTPVRTDINDESAKKGLYADCERNSSTSVTKLLLRV